MTPEFISASIDICFPGMASRVKRAVTSAIRPAPLVMTTKLMITKIRKMTARRVVPANDEGPEGLDHRACVAIKQDQAGRGHVKTEAVQGNGKKNGRENGKLRWFLDVDDREKDEEGNSDAEDQQNAEDILVNRNYEQKNGTKEAKYETEVGISSEPRESVLYPT